jgi:hypothetical protein
VAVNAGQAKLHMSIVRELNWLRGKGHPGANYNKQKITNSRPDRSQLRPTAQKLSPLSMHSHLARCRRDAKKDP